MLDTLDAPKLAETDDDDTVDFPPDPQTEDIAGDEPAPEAAPPPEEPSEEAMQLRDIAKLNDEVYRLEYDYLMKKEMASDAKKGWEAGCKRLQSLIKGLTEFYPMFDAKPTESTPEAKDEEWRETAIDILTMHGLSEAVATKLEEAAIATLGALADWTSGGKLLTDIDGVGEKKAEAIEKALESFWAAYGPVAEPAAQDETN